MAWYRTGTITGVSGSTTVTGTDTLFKDTAAGVNAGDMLLVGSGTNARAYEIGAVNNDTTLTLVTDIDVAFTNASYQIVTSFSMSNNSLAKKVAASFDRILSGIDNWTSIFTGSGVIDITTWDGQELSGPAWNSLAQKGVNNDINQMNALQDAINDNQPVTFRQLKAATSGGAAVGANMTGVMNNFLGAVEWFNGSRALLPAGHLAYDGQVVSQVVYADLWNAVNSGMFASTTDADWQATPTGRGAYSKGGAAGTAPAGSGVTDAWFRLPDLNGVWVHPTNSALNSIPGLFLRGDGTVANTGSGSGAIRWSAAPNITGEIGAGSFKALLGHKLIAVGDGTGSLKVTNAGDQLLNSGGDPYRFYQFKIDASLSSVAYGRDASTEVRPNSVKGVWIGRVNGRFSAANTNFNVINGMTSAPATGAVVYGGDLRSALQLNGADYLVAAVRPRVTGGGAKVFEMRLVDSTTNPVTTSIWTMPTAGGELALSTDSRLGTVNGKTGGTISSATTINGLLTTNASINTNGAMTVWSQPSSSNPGQFLNAPGLKSRLNNRGGNADPQGAYGVMYFQEWVGNYHSLLFNLNGFNSDYTWQMRAGGQTFSPLGELQYSGSDVRLKSDFTQTPDGALDRINKIGSVEFILNANGRKCRGYLAQQLQDIDEMYTFEGGEATDENGETFTILNVDQTAIISDLILAVQTLNKQVSDLQERLNSKA